MYINRTLISHSSNGNFDTVIWRTSFITYFTITFSFLFFFFIHLTTMLVLFTSWAVFSFQPADSITLGHHRWFKSKWRCLLRYQGGVVYLLSNMEREAAVLLRHWSNRFIYMYANWFTLVFTHTIKRTRKVFEAHQMANLQGVVQLCLQLWWDSNFVTLSS